MKHLFSNLRGNLFGGITAGIVALPLALAFGVSSGLGPSAGLYGAIFLSFFAALFGGTPTQISGPTAPMTAVSMVVIAGIIATYDGIVEEALPAILMVFLLAGLMQVTLGLLKLGIYVRYIPYPVISGFMTAIGLIIIITQLLPALGYYPKEDEVFINTFKPQAEELLLENILEDEAGEGILVLEDFKETIERSGEITSEAIHKEAESLASSEASGVIGAIRVFPRAFSKLNWIELILTLITILIIYGFKRITRVIPSTLVALLLVSGIAFFFKIDYRPIEVIPQGLPLPEMRVFTEFDLETITPYLFTAFTLALLGAIDSLLTSVVADNITKTRHQPNRELVGQGIGNSISALFGGLPGAGATIRTVVNINAGGTTKLSGMISGILLLFILLALGPVASNIPAAVLAGILITVGISVMDYRGLKAIPSLPKNMRLGPFRISADVVIMVIVMVLATFWNLVYAVGIGLIIASLIFMKAIGDLTAKRSEVRPLQPEKAWPDEKNFPESLEDTVFIKHLKGPLFFGNTSGFHQLSAQIPPKANTVILRLGRMQYMDQSGLYAMEEVLRGLAQKGVTILFVNLLEQPRYLMEGIDIIPELVPEAQIFDSFGACIRWIRKNIPVPNDEK
ncbi:SulP family inorganic anion transporter [Robiginitalea aurantiaca]|uniref:SulP family inorganic anion transporter n=1 Tax=Robiginitalea aurantiaca TaxID=3056915 RepID=A0ABT7WE96_9FLAO|nr:SulP family inorganic anion transporter [Robiginitalea aurantiaca]MDM9631235.1 SulP family inorganic anion transporter [Robiginitalea aurantiaca]